MSWLPDGGIGMYGRCVLALAILALGLATGTAVAATPRPDAHDRELAHVLAAKVAAFEALTAKTSGDSHRLDNRLKSCKGLGNTPGEAFSAVFVLLPVLLIDVVNEIRPQLTQVRSSIAALRPHAPLFRSWLTAETGALDQVLAFDNHGKKIDYCAAARVLLAKKSTNAQVRQVLGIDPSRIKVLFGPASSAESTRLKRLDTRMRPFLIAAGLSAKDAATLTK